MSIVDRAALTRRAAVMAARNPKVREVMDALIDGAMQGDFDMRGYFEREGAGADEGWLPAATGITVIASDGVKYTFSGPVKYREGAEDLWND